jgi:hypothetical protein
MSQTKRYRVTVLAEFPQHGPDTETAREAFESLRSRFPRARVTLGTAADEVGALVAVTTHAESGPDLEGVHDAAAAIVNHAEGLRGCAQIEDFDYEAEGTK